MTTPNFYKPSNAGVAAYRPDARALLGTAETFRKTNGIKSATVDKTNIHLLLIDVQSDFCFPTGTLYVGGRSGTGAVDDSARIAEFIYRNIGVISAVSCTLDAHYPFQIFFPSFWLDQNGQHPQPHTVISVADITSGKYSPNPAVAGMFLNGNIAWLRKYVEHYASELEAAGKYQLYLWPEHCLLGGPGANLVGVIDESTLFWSYVRGAQREIEVKGTNPFTENYSVFRPEVLTRWDGSPIAQKNTSFLDKLTRADVMVIAGQAASHCVKSSIDDLLNEINTRDPSLVRKVYILRDCMSAVAVPDGRGGFFADFTPQAEDALKKFQQAGMNVVDSTTDIRSWPGINL